MCITGDSGDLPWPHGTSSLSRETGTQCVVHHSGTTVGDRGGGQRVKGQACPLGASAPGCVLNVCPVAEAGSLSGSVAGGGGLVAGMAGRAQQGRV